MDTVLLDVSEDVKIMHENHLREGAWNLARYGFGLLENRFGWEPYVRVSILHDLANIRFRNGHDSIPDIIEISVSFRALSYFSLDPQRERIMREFENILANEPR